MAVQRWRTPDGSAAVETAAKVTVKYVLAVTLPSVAVTARILVVVSGTVRSVLKFPSALVFMAKLVLPMVTVPAVFFGNPRPLTVEVEPTGPVFGLNETVAVLAAAAALGVPVRPADPARTVSNTTKPASADRM